MTPLNTAAFTVDVKQDTSKTQVTSTDDDSGLNLWWLLLLFALVIACVIFIARWRSRPTPYLS